MPVYSYKCPACSSEFDNYWPLEDYKNPTPCPNCETISNKLFNSVVFHSNEGGGFESGFNPGLGEYVHDRADFKRKIKEKGLQEVGNESVAKSKSKGKRTGYTDADLRKIKQMGAEFSGKEAEALKNGEKLHN